MPITIRFQGGKLAGQVKTFGDDIEIITIGRNPDRCQVVFPPEETHVGREHCALKRSLGRYRLQLNGEDRVLVNGREGYHEEELPASADLRLGPAGPQIVVTTTDAPGMPATVARGRHEPGIGTMLQHERKQANRGVLLGLLALIAILIAADIGYRLHQQSVADVTKTQNELDKTGPEIADHMRDIKGSVYLVLVKNSLNQEWAEGTAWVVGDQTLATNTHVAEAFLSEIGPGESVYVRSPSSPPQDFLVTAATVHPGFEDFQRYVVPRRPSLKSMDAASGEADLGLIPACDVAILTVSGSGLAKPIPLASQDEINAIQVGDVIGMIGYPSEGVTGHNTANPEPSSQVGRIVRNTDFLMRTDVPLDQLQLIHHSVPETGGASGSPIINADGKVIAINSGANFYGLSNGARVPLAVGLNFAQRADLLQELLDHHADDAQKNRLNQWQQELAKYDLQNADEDAIRTNDVTNAVSQTIGKHATEVSRKTVNLVKPRFFGDYQASVDIPIPEAGLYLIHFYDSNFDNVGTKLLKTPTADEALASLDPAASGWYRRDFLAPDTVTLTADGSGEFSSSIDVVLYELKDDPPATLPAQ